MLGYSSSVSRSTLRPRCLRLEHLETRAMLSHPAVVAVNVASTQWAPSFVSYLESAGLGAGGYAVPTGATQLQSLPWNNIDQIRITFGEDVNIQAADLSISGVNTTALPFSGFSYDSNTYTATWTLAAPLTKDKLLLDLDANGMGPVKSVSSGDVLDGAWTNGQSTFPSGNGQGGTDFEFRINVLPADANATNTVTSLDIGPVVQRVGKNAGDAGYDIRCDINGSGSITSSDVAAVQLKLGSVLPSGDPAGVSNDAPSTSGIPDLGIAAGTVDHVLSLTDFFADAETASADLAYSIVQNTNSSLFSSLTINSSKELDLSFATGVKGDATLTIRATDPSGLFVETTLDVHVSDAPFIADFYVMNEIGDYWTINGTVGDDDDPVGGYVIVLGGVLANYHLTVTTIADGTFSLTIELPGLTTGSATAQTTDPHGVLSELVYDWVEVV